MAINMTKLVLVTFFLLFVTRGTGGLPRRWYSDSELPGTDVSPLQSYQRTKPSEQVYNQRKILSKGNYAINGDDVASRSDGKIIFPSDDMDSHPSDSQKYIPLPPPSCENSTFCEHAPNYPNDLVETALRMNKDLKFLSGVDVVPDVVHRVNTQPEDTSLCEAYEKIVYPKVAQSKDKEWLFVVNQGDFTQGVRVETCGKENSVCNLIEGFAEGYKTTCKQKYIYRQLVAVSPGGQIKPEMFRFPASCCCHIKFTGNPLLRLGVSSNKKGGLPTSKARRK